MKKISILLLFVPFVIFVQKGIIAPTNYTLFEIDDLNDTIHFLIADSSISTKKPVFLFFQGSQPIPLLIDLESDNKFVFGCGLNNFDLEKIREKFHIVVISMPATPPIVKKSQLDVSYNYVDGDGYPYIEFQKQDFIENYLGRANKVLEYLKTQTWIDSSQMVVAGHSQGAKIAVLFAKANKTITHLGLFGLNAFGRIDQDLRQLRKDAENGKTSWFEVEKETQNILSFYKYALDSTNFNNHPELISWKSFSKPVINDLLEIDIPIYLTYGTEDLGAELCDMIPLYFIRNGKSNLSIKRHHSLDHNFFEVKENGRANFEKPHWNIVMNEFIDLTRN